jgi:hypothetical protein
LWISFRDGRGEFLESRARHGTLQHRKALPGPAFGGSSTKLALAVREVPSTAVQVDNGRHLWHAKWPSALTLKGVAGISRNAPARISWGRSCCADCFCLFQIKGIRLYRDVIIRNRSSQDRQNLIFEHLTYCKRPHELVLVVADERFKAVLFNWESERPCTWTDGSLH